MSLSPVDALKRRARQKQSELASCDDPVRRFELLRERNELLRQARTLASAKPSTCDLAGRSGVSARTRRRPRHPGLQLAIERCGGVPALARRLGLTVRSVASWRRAPAEHVAAIALAAGLPVAWLCADLAEAGRASFDALSREP